MLAAGFDLPYVGAQVGHRDPAVTLAVSAQVIERPDRDRLRAEMRELLGEDRPAVSGPMRAVDQRVTGREEAPKGPELDR
jgi:hypothetical protein